MEKNMEHEMYTGLLKGVIGKENVREAKDVRALSTKRIIIF